MHLPLGLGVARQRIDTIIAFRAAQETGVKAEGGSEATTREVMAELAGMIADERLVVLVAAAYPLERVCDAFAEVERAHTRGKIDLVP